MPGGGRKQFVFAPKPVAARPATTAEPVQRQATARPSTLGPALGRYISQSIADSVAAATRPLPHQAAIQHAFGTHDVSKARATVGGAAATASEQLGANAFAQGEHVAFGEEPDLHLAAHEAAHVVQRQHGVQLDAKSGTPDDPYEHHADAVADAVVAGHSAAHLFQALPRGRTGAAIQRHADPTTAAARVTTEANGTSELVIAIAFRGAPIFVELSPDDDVLARFTADPTLATTLAAAVAATLDLPTGPAPETAAYVGGPIVHRALLADLLAWSGAPTAAGGFPTLRILLEARAAALAAEHVRADLETYAGVDPGTVDWLAQLPAMREAIQAHGDNTLSDDALRDRAEQVLVVLESEMDAAPPVVGGTAPPNLDALAWDFCTAYRFADANVRVFSEKFLAEYVALMDALVFVPPGFDLARFAPSGADLAQTRRDELLDEWVDTHAQALAEQYILDDWTASGVSQDAFLAALDLGAERDGIYARITSEFMTAARTDVELMRAVESIASVRARYDELAAIVTVGHSGEALDHGYAAALTADAPDTESLQDLIGDPGGVYETQFALAQATRNILESAQAGANVDVAILTSAVQLAQSATGFSSLGFGAFITEYVLHVRAFQQVLAEQRTAAEQTIAARVDLSWQRIQDVIRDLAQAADDFVQNTWIPTLQAIATEHVDANAAELQDYRDHFDERLPQEAGRYRLAAYFIEDVATRLASGEAPSARLGDSVVTRADVGELHTAIATLRAKADELETPSGADDKRESIQDALDVYTDVREKIADGTYAPTGFGEAIVVEAKQRLGIGVFEGSTLLQQASRIDVVAENPFEAWAIARWRVIEIIDDAAWSLISGFLRGALTLASLLVPGVGGLILAGIDIAIGLYQGVQAVGAAHDRLELARLDTQLEIQGITVEQAEHALRMAWVSLVLEAALAGLFAALAGRLVIGGVRRALYPGLARLADADAALAATLVERLGSSRAAETVAAHFASDAARLTEVLSLATDGRRILDARRARARSRTALAPPACRRLGHRARRVPLALPQPRLARAHARDRRRRGPERALRSRRQRAKRRRSDSEARRAGCADVDRRGGDTGAVVTSGRARRGRGARARGSRATRPRRGPAPLWIAARPARTRERRCAARRRDAGSRPTRGGATGRHGRGPGRDRRAAHGRRGRRSGRARREAAPRVRDRRRRGSRRSTPDRNGRSIDGEHAPAGAALGGAHPERPARSRADVLRAGGRSSRAPLRLDR
ncbi:MAG TPA: DUF4157 domain-containing protein [Kofleriaceae bacterium]